MQPSFKRFSVNVHKVGKQCVTFLQRYALLCKNAGIVFLANKGSKLINFNHVAFKYRKTDGSADKEAVRDVCLNIEEGSFHFLSGPSGAGKTTLFRMMYMDLLPTVGSVTLFGKNVSRLSREEVAHTRRRMGVVFQDFRLLEHLNVRENVSLPLSLHGKLSQEQEKCVDEILDWVGLGDKLDKHPSQLSGGEKQRVSIARAVVNRPRLLVADEPTGNVDAAMGQRIMHLFMELNKHGTTVVVATHDRELVESFPYPCIYLKDGKVVSKNTKTDSSMPKMPLGDNSGRVA